MFRLLLTFLHLIATCVALGTILVTDWRLFCGRDYVMRAGALARLLFTKRLVSRSLFVLWITGLLIVWLGQTGDPLSYLMNEKLWAKTTVVLVLTINGVLLHRIAFPQFERQTALSETSTALRLGVLLLGAISLMSWLFAAFLGVARPLNFNIVYADAMTAYAVVIGIAAVAVAIFCIAGSGNGSRRALGRHSLATPAVHTTHVN